MRQTKIAGMINKMKSRSPRSLSAFIRLLDEDEDAEAEAEAAKEARKDFTTNHKENNKIPNTVWILEIPTRSRKLVGMSNRRDSKGVIMTVMNTWIAAEGRVAREFE